jgi:Skp family chaperone for outer membrane proteins
MDRSQWKQWVLIAAAVCLAVFVWEAASDEPATVEKSRLPIGLVDMAKVFKDDRAFQQKLAEIKTRVEEFERYVRDRQAEIAKLAPQGSAEGSGEASEAAKRAAALQTALSAEIAAKRQAFLAEEAVVYHERYQAIERAVEQICGERGIDLVLRFNGDKMDPADRNSVLQGVNRAVIYSRVPDLTNDVVKTLNNSIP